MDRFKVQVVSSRLELLIMLASGTSSPSLLGYLAFEDLAAHGLVGGYLLVNRQARPIEFHCTAPIRPSRTHEILYGPTLRGVLCGEQIGPSLAAQSEWRPELVLTDEPEALALREHLEMPVVLLLDKDDTHGLAAHALPPWTLAVGSRTVTTSPSAVGDRQLIERTLEQLAGQWDLAEPIARIRAAIHEAQRAAA